MCIRDRDEIDIILASWRRVPHRQHLIPVDSLRLTKRLAHSDHSFLIAVSDGVRRSPSQRDLLDSLELCDPRFVCSVSVLRLFEQHQERLPPVLIGDSSFTYDDLPWAATFSIQAQLKRMSDLVLAILLLFITCLLYTSPSPRDATLSRMPSSA